VRCHALAGALAKNPDAISGRQAGDGLVPLQSALGEHRDPQRKLGIPASRQHIVYATGHLGLLDSAEACAQMCWWLTR
jgi:hypothetical protein